MMPDAALMQALGELAERYLDQEPHPACFVCHEWPATTPLVYTVDATEVDRVRGAAFGLCVLCLLDENLQTRIAQALSMARAQRQGRWN
jgi:hypothetical protein